MQKVLGPAFGKHPPLLCPCIVVDLFLIDTVFKLRRVFNIVYDSSASTLAEALISLYAERTFFDTMEWYYTFSPLKQVWLWGDIYIRIKLLHHCRHLLGPLG